MKKLNTVIYGATGSIGLTTISIIKDNIKLINIEGLTCDKNIKKLCNIADKFNVKKIGFNESALKKKENVSLNKYEVFDDISKFDQMISKKTDIIVFATSGIDSLNLFTKILKSGKVIGVANKECIISIGHKLNKYANEYATKIIPLDSEHNSIYHLLKQNLGSYNSVTITATGGPFYKYSKSQLKRVTIKQALNHPIWKMGKKNSIDSATMMNKALEIIEAKYLFNLNNNEIDAVIHPQAIIHALINYDNGMSTAILNKPDMSIPISSLFFKLNKFTKHNNKFNLINYSKLEFFPINEKSYPSIRLAYNIMEMGGLAPHVFNYLNEILVKSYISKKIKFIEIVKYIELNLDLVFNKNHNISDPNFNDLNNINNWIDNNLFIGN